MAWCGRVVVPAASRIFRYKKGHGTKTQSLEPHDGNTAELTVILHAGLQSAEPISHLGADLGVGPAPRAGTWVLGCGNACGVRRPPGCTALHVETFTLRWRILRRCRDTATPHWGACARGPSGGLQLALPPERPK